MGEAPIQTIVLELLIGDESSVNTCPAILLLKSLRRIVPMNRYYGGSVQGHVLSSRSAMYPNCDGFCLRVEFPRGTEEDATTQAPKERRTENEGVDCDTAKSEQQATPTLR